MGDRLHRGFGRLRAGGALATFTAFEADLLRSLAAQLIVAGDAPVQFASR